MADMIQSLGVLIGGGIIWVKPKWVLVDLICTLVFSSFPLAATLPMLKNIFWILMERAPREMDIEKVERGLKCIKGVKIVHGLHVWEITVEGELYCLAMSCPNPVLVLKRSFLIGVSLLAIKVSSWEANPRNSFGFKRLKVLAAFLSVQLVWLVSRVIIYEFKDFLAKLRGQ
ncbi:hypothetical protein F2Q69_00011788 [Brassica cretica]|uniref:Cation efflux protein transmembrane domain-containing protein n=1 Tax=Brassica cretica TaxID=69181 RepID=A0A8S9QZV7_BRACR|nr:hypothetical protein F2Q69_00011788 [Brassica cretica]